jgi:hypothetical protein
MKRILVLAAAMLILHAAPSVSQDKTKEDPKAKTPKEKGKDAGANEAAMMELWKKVGTPGPGHKRLEGLVGKWDYKMKAWTEPGEPPDESSGVSEFKWVLGKRFLQAESSGTFMKMPYESLWLLGYDNFKKKYVMNYTDNMTTAMIGGTGVISPDGKTITLFGVMDEWLTDEHDKPVKYVMRLGDKDRWSFEIHDLSLEETKAIEITYTRKK